MYGVARRNYALLRSPLQDGVEVRSAIAASGNVLVRGVRRARMTERLRGRRWGPRLSLLSEGQKETRNGKRGESARGRAAGIDGMDGWKDGRRWEKLKGTSSAVEREDDHVQVVGWNNVEREGMRDGEEGGKEGRKDGDK